MGPRIPGEELRIAARRPDDRVHPIAHIDHHQQEGCNCMSDERWDKRYLDGETPWDSGTVCEHLPTALQDFGIGPCKALEIGCGTGTNAVWLAQQGFDVTGVDISGEAIRRAEEKVEKAGASCRFLVASALEMEIEGGPFGLVFDRGCFHTNNTAWDRSAFAASVARHLTDDGYWLSLIGSTDGAPRESGPPRRSVLDIAAAVEPHLEIVELKATRFSPEPGGSPESWRCMMRKRRQW